MELGKSFDDFPKCLFTFYIWHLIITIFKMVVAPATLHCVILDLFETTPFIYLLKEIRLIYILFSHVLLFWLNILLSFKVFSFYWFTKSSTWNSCVGASYNRRMGSRISLWAHQIKNTLRRVPLLKCAAFHRTLIESKLAKNLWLWLRFSETKYYLLLLERCSS